MKADYAIVIDGLSKSFDRRTVLDSISLNIRRGSITAVLGPNASGKSTLIKSVLGLVNPDTGSIRLDDEPIIGRWEYRKRVGYMPQIARFPDNLSVDELFSMLKDIRGSGDRAVFNCPTCKTDNFDLFVGCVFWDFDLYFDEAEQIAQSNPYIASIRIYEIRSE